MLRFVDAILNPASPFMQAFLPFQSRIAEPGIYNSPGRFVASLVPDAARARIVGAVWGNTRTEVPDDMPALRDVFTGNEIPVRHAGSRASIEAATVFQRFPVASLVPSSLSPVGLELQSDPPTAADR